ncbi:hypothetical protein ACLOJK_035209 [Asimina triloba]
MGDEESIQFKEFSFHDSCNNNLRLPLFQAHDYEGFRTSYPGPSDQNILFSSLSHPTSTEMSFIVAFALLLLPSRTSCFLHNSAIAISNIYHTSFEASANDASHRLWSSGDCRRIPPLPPLSAHHRMMIKVRLLHWLHLLLPFLEDFCQHNTVSLPKTKLSELAPKLVSEFGIVLSGIAAAAAFVL